MIRSKNNDWFQTTPSSPSSNLTVAIYIYIYIYIHIYIYIYIYCEMNSYPPPSITCRYNILPMHSHAHGNNHDRPPDTLG